MIYPAAGISLSTGSGWTTSVTNSSANWNTAYSQTLQWNGGSTSLVAPTGRTSLGLGSAAVLASENPMTGTSANLPTSAAVKAYGDTNWGASGGGEFGAAGTSGAGGTLAVTGNAHYIQLDAGASFSAITIDAVTAPEGHVLVIRGPETGSRTMLDGGNIQCQANFTFDNKYDTVMLMGTGTVWLELSRADNV